MNESRAMSPWKRLGRIVLALWIFGVSAFFFVRFSFEFYRSNQTAIHSIWQSPAK